MRAVPRILVSFAIILPLQVNGILSLPLEEDPVDFYRSVRLSSIFKWFEEDFLAISGSDRNFQGRPEVVGAVLVFISRCITKDQGDLLRDPSFRIKYEDYDWSLNERK